MPGTGSGTVIAGRSSMVVRFCAPADNEVAATSIAANVSDLIMLYLLGPVPAPTRGYEMRSALAFVSLATSAWPEGFPMIALVGNPRRINELDNRPVLPKGPPGEPV
jgi:hypothetical protein